MFSIGLVIYALAEFFIDEDETILNFLIEVVGLIGIFLMIFSVAIFAWGVMP